MLMKSNTSTPPKRRPERARRLLTAGVGTMLTVALLVPATLVASGVEKKGMRSIARSADAVLTGTVSGLESHWVGKKIVTTAEISVEKSFKGDQNPGQTIRVSLPGGRVSKPVAMVMIVNDAPVLVENEEALLFLRNGADGTLTVAEKHEIHHDAATGAQSVEVGGRVIAIDALEKKRHAIENRGDGKPRRTSEDGGR